MQLKIADIILHRHEEVIDPLPFLIQFFQRCLWNHMSVYIGDDSVVQGGKGGVQIKSLYEISGKKLILRMSLSHIQQLIIKDEALRHLGKKFNWFTIFGFSYARRTRLSCSDLIRIAYTKAGVDLDLWMPRDIAYDERFDKIKGEVK